MPETRIREEGADPEMCPFDPTQPKAEDCRWAEECPWHVQEGGHKCYCAVGEAPEMQLRKQIAARSEKEESDEEA